MNLNNNESDPLPPQPKPFTLRVKNTKTEADIILIGTSHVSKKAQHHVVDLLTSFRPDTVVLEVPENVKLKHILIDDWPPTKPTFKWRHPIISVFERVYYEVALITGSLGGEFSAACRVATKMGARVVFCG